MSTLRVVFFGMYGVFSRIPLEALLAAGVEVCAVVVPCPRSMAPDAPLRLLTPPPRRNGALSLVGEAMSPGGAGIQPIQHWGRLNTGDPRAEQAGTARDDAPLRPLPILLSELERGTAALAWERGIPVFDVSDLAHTGTVAALTRLRPDAICVACFPRLLPPTILQIPRLGALNLHPSLLPEYRGPYPLFWVLHDGIEHAGVTLHLMDAGADSGPIVAQAPVALPDGSGYGAAERRCAEAGARLLVAALHGAARSGVLPARPQPAPAGCHARTPRAEDFVVTDEWPARRAYNFLRGIAEWHHPITMRVDTHSIAVSDALSYDADARLSAPLQWHGDMVSVRCASGSLVVRVRA